MPLLRGPVQLAATSVCRTAKEARTAERGSSRLTFVLYALSSSRRRSFGDRSAHEHHHLLHGSSLEVAEARKIHSIGENDRIRLGVLQDEDRRDLHLCWLLIRLAQRASHNQPPVTP